MSDTPPVYVLSCQAFDSAGVCTSQVWVPQTSWVDGLPSVEDADAVGAALFVLLVGLTALKLLLKPKKEIVE